MGTLYIGGSSSGGGTFSIQELTASSTVTTGTITGWDYMVLVDCSANNMTIALPSSSVASYKGHSVNIKRIDNSNNICNIIPSTVTESIEGITNNSIYLYGKNDSVTITSLGSGDSKITADNRNSTGSTMSFCRVTNLTGQSTGLTANSPLQFNTIETIQGTGISYNTSTYAFTLQPNRTYKLIAYIPKINLSGGGYFYTRWWNDTTSSFLGAGSGGDSNTSNSNTMTGTTASCIITPSVVTTMRCLIKGLSIVTAIGDPDDALSAEVEEISRQASVISSVDYGFVRYTGTDTTTLTANQQIIFDSTLQSGNMNYSNNGLFTLKAGKSYELESFIQIYNTSGSCAGKFQFYNYTDSISLKNANGVFLSVSSSPSDNLNGNGILKTLYTPLKDVQVGIKYLGSFGSTPGIVGSANISTNSAVGSTYFKVTQIGSSATTSVPANLIPALSNPPVGTEIDTGMTWIDGRHIYRQSYTGTISGTSNSITNVSSTFTGVAVISGKGFATRVDNVIETLGDTNTSFMVGGTNLYIFNTSVLNGKAYSIVVDYVKAT